jgi:DNA-directed RNA polymerase beta' subunit
MGFFNESKPKDLIIKQLLVSPPQVRPSIEMNPVQCSHDDLTNVYLKIIKLNNEIVSNPNSKNVDKLIE